MEISSVRTVAVSHVAFGVISVVQEVTIAEGAQVLGSVPVQLNIIAGEPRPAFDAETETVIAKLFSPDVLEEMAARKAAAEQKARDDAEEADKARRQLFDDTIAQLTDIRGTEHNAGHTRTVAEIDAAIPVLERMRDNNEPFDPAAVPAI